MRNAYLHKLVGVTTRLLSSKRHRFLTYGALTGTGICLSVVVPGSGLSDTEHGPGPRRCDYTYVVCGAGPAGLSALAVLREHATAKDSILLVAPEIRPMSGTFFPNPVPAIITEHRNQESDQEPYMDVMTGSSLVAVDPTRRTIALSSGAEISFKKLLIATGGDLSALSIDHVVAPQARNRVGFIQSNQWSSKVGHLLSESKVQRLQQTHFTIVGGSWTAACTASQLVKDGAAVTILFAEPALLARHFPRYISDELKRRFEWRSDSTFDILPYSVLRYISSEEEPVHRRVNPTVAEKEAGVHTALVFDPLTTFNFRTDFILLAPTMLSASQFIRSTQVDSGGRLVTNQELSVYTDVYAAGSCTASSVSSDDVRNLDYWTSSRAVATGRHAAWNMLGKREPFERKIPLYSVDLSGISLNLHCIGIPDGGAETYGDFTKSSNELSSHSSGGQLSRGVLFYVDAVPQHRGTKVVGIVVWDGEQQSSIRAQRALLLGERFLESPTFYNPQTLEAAMEQFCQDILFDSHEIEGGRADGPGLPRDMNDRRRLLKRHVQARKIPIRGPEIMWYNPKGTINDRWDVPQRARAEAYDAPLPRSSDSRSQ